MTDYSPRKPAPVPGATNAKSNGRVPPGFFKRRVLEIDTLLMSGIGQEDLTDRERLALLAFCAFLRTDEQGRRITSQTNEQIGRAVRPNAKYPQSIGSKLRKALREKGWLVTIRKGGGRGRAPVEALLSRVVQPQTSGSKRGPETHCCSQ